MCRRPLPCRKRRTERCGLRRETWLFMPDYWSRSRKIPGLREFSRICRRPHGITIFLRFVRRRSRAGSWKRGIPSAGRGQDVVGVARVRVVLLPGLEGAGAVRGVELVPGFAREGSHPLVPMATRRVRRGDSAVDVR